MKLILCTVWLALAAPNAENQSKHRWREKLRSVIIEARVEYGQTAMTSVASNAGHTTKWDARANMKYTTEFTTDGQKTMKKITYGITKHFGRAADACGGVGPRDVLNFGDCDSIEAAVEKYKSFSIHRFEDSQPVDGGGAFREVSAKEIGSRLPFVSREAIVAAKRASQVNWDKLENWYGFLPDWAETPERHATRRATEKHNEG